jgi:hypothetical protein
LFAAWTGSAACAPPWLSARRWCWATGRHPNLGWAGLGGFEAILADTGGLTARACRSLATLSLGGAAGLFLGSLAVQRLHWALPVTVLWCFVWSYLAVLGQPFSSAGVLVQVIYICGVGAPTTSWREALLQALLLLAGGAWAALLSLLLWPLDAYRPARSAVSACYDRTGLLPRLRWPSLAAAAAARGSWHRLAQHHQYRIRRAVEQGWQAVAAIRAEHQSETAQGHHLVVLLENADLLIARTVALAEHLEAQAGPSRIEPALTAAWPAWPICARPSSGSPLLVPPRTVRSPTACAIRQQMERLPRYLEGCLSRPIGPGQPLSAIAG